MNGSVAGDSCWQTVAESLIGVVDLKQGCAVHAIAGDRGSYEPLGTPIQRIEDYRRAGLRRFYLADLDALTGGPRQWFAVTAILSRLLPHESVLLDVGWRGNESSSEFLIAREIMAAHANVDWVLASETALACHHVAEIVAALSPQKTVLGIDFRGVRFLGPSTVQQWIAAADVAGIRRGLILDIARVGTRSGPESARLCRQIAAQVEGWTWVSGGGIRTPRDVHEFLIAGCEYCLIATALLGINGTTHSDNDLRSPTLTSDSKSGPASI